MYWCFMLSSSRVFRKLEQQQRPLKVSPRCCWIHRLWWADKLWHHVPPAKAGQSQRETKDDSQVNIHFFPAMVANPIRGGIWRTNINIGLVVSNLFPGTRPHATRYTACLQLYDSEENGCGGCLSLSGTKLMALKSFPGLQ